jgi:hypothetical protein
MEIGKIIELDTDNGIGFINTKWAKMGMSLSINKEDILHKKQFLLSDYQSQYGLCLGRLVVFENHSFANAINVRDFIPYIHPQFIGVTWFEIKDNPQLVDYYIDTSIYSKIHHLKRILHNRDYFNLRYHINRYEVVVKEEGYNRPGKDDKAGIYIRTSTLHDESEDQYLTTILPKYSRTVATDGGFIYWKLLLEGLWDDLGGKDKVMPQLEKECKEIQSERIIFARKNYDEEVHRKHILDNYLVELENLKII